jgi:hypothetical protein
MAGDSPGHAKPKFLCKLTQEIDCENLDLGDDYDMFFKLHRRGIWVPKACFWPIVIIGLIVIGVDSCTRR